MEFAVLPDREVQRDLTDALLALGLTVVSTHPSGRPWLFSDAPDRWRVLTPGRGARVAVPEERGIGMQLPNESIADPQYLDQLAGTITIHTFFLSTIDKVSRVRGTISTDRQIFWGVVDGVPVATNTLKILHHLLNPSIDEIALTLSLISSLPIQPFARRTPWEGIHAVGVGHLLTFDTAGRVREERWWWDPGRDLDCSQATLAVRSALYSSVGEASIESALVSSDLSGGLDSTSICFILHDLGHDFTTYRTSSLSASNDETERARLVARELDIPLREFAPLAESSSAFDLDIETNSRALLEGPLVWAASRRYVEALAPTIARDGSHVHFTGLGGDELFDLVPGLFRSVWRENRIRALALIRHFQLSQRIDPRPLLKGAASKEHYANYLLRVARALDGGDSDLRPADAYSWFPPIVLPTWLSQKARTIIVEEIKKVAEDPPSPLGKDPAAQQTTESIAFQGKILRQFGELFHNFDIDWRGPFTDVRVLRAVLRAPATARFSTINDKPLLAAAIGNAALPDFYAKRGRSDFTSDIYAEHRRRRGALAEEFESCLLAEHDLVERPTIVSVVYEPSSNDVGLLDVERIATAERWLRGVHAMGRTP